MSMPTPRLELDLDVIGSRLAQLASALGRARLHYAVKANPDHAVLAVVHRAGHTFDVASATEIEAALAVGADPAELVHSNPVRSPSEVVHAHVLGVRTFVVDSLAEVDKLDALAPGSDVLVRLITSGTGADVPLLNKFGTDPETAEAILRRCTERRLTPRGIAFHVGSQQRDPHAWTAPILTAADVLSRLTSRQEQPWVLDIGGGFPAAVGEPCPPFAAYGAVIERALWQAFGSDHPRVIAEPGRAVVGDAGTLVAEVIGVAERGGRRWVHLDAGVYTGLVETIDDAVRYQLSTTASGPTGPAVLTGPTCDSTDVMYTGGVELPLALAPGDEVRFHSAGAYTTGYSTTFNGFAPLAATILRRSAVA